MPFLRSFVSARKSTTGLLDKRERNAHGKPGKLHAKVAVIDDQVVLSSANLTDDAFNRNLELGALFSSDEIIQRLREHFDSFVRGWHIKVVESPECKVSNRKWACIVKVTDS